MKKRIIALALVIATLVLTLTGCAFRYDRKDMSDYLVSDVKFEALEALLKNVLVDDGDFGKYEKDSTARDDKVLENIDTVLGGKVKTDKIKDTAYGFRQKIFYAYYCTYTDEATGKVYTFDTLYMGSDKIQNFFSYPSYTAGKANAELLNKDTLAAEIFAKIKDLDVDEYAYSASTSTADTLKVGETVCVTYKYAYIDGTEKHISADKALIVIEEAPQAGATRIGHLIAGKKIGKVAEADITGMKFTDPEKGECTLESMEIHFKTSGKSVEVPYVITAAKSGVKDAYDTSKTVNIPANATITYHVHPAYAYALPELNATAVLTTVFGDSITTSSLPCFNDNAEMKKVVDEIVKLKTAYDSAKSKVSTAGSSATQAQKDAEKKAKEALDAKVAKLPEDMLKVSGAEALIMKEYKQSIYDKLEAEYDTDIQNKVGKILWNWIKNNVKVDRDNLPKQAVKDAEERIIAGEKYTYYTGSKAAESSSSTATPWVELYKTFDEYLNEGSTTYKNEEDVYAAIEEDAKDQVVELVKIYAVAQEYVDQGKIDRVTNADVSLYLDDLYPQLFYTFYFSGNTNPSTQDIEDLYGKTALRTALTMDRLMGYFLKTEMVDDSGKVVEEGGHVKYVNLTIKYK